jgi:hypothetical protein
MKRVILAAAAVLASGCVPYAIIDGSGIATTDTSVRKVTIMAVDDQMYPGQPYEVQVDPGPHLLEVSTTMTDHTGLVTHMPFGVNAKPCVRYYVVAKHEAPVLSQNNWEPILVQQEPIAGCKLPEKRGGG